MQRFHLKLKSSNKKTGPIPVSTSPESTCPTICPLKRNGCYAKSGPLALHWNKVSVGHRGVSWHEFLNQIRSFPADQLWRHNQAGDLPGLGNMIDSSKLCQLVLANRDKRGFTYTHKAVFGSRYHANRALISAANDLGFTINLSANNLDHADRLIDLDVGPVASIVPMGTKSGKTKNGNKMIICPAYESDKIQCASCAMCQKAGRAFIVGLPVHGGQSKRAAAIASDSK